MTGEPAEAATAPSVVIAVPVYRSRLAAEELISWQHLQHFLGRLEIRLFLPESLDNPLPEVPTERFPDEFFESVDTYSRLLLSEAFYRRFEAWEFLLIYQLDALVFSHHIAPWCAAGFDYLGAPWWRDQERPELGFSRVGNGGLSLRRVARFLSVLTTPRRPSWLDALKSPPPDLEDLPTLRRWRRRVRIHGEARRGVRWYGAHYSLGEDHFWADRASLFDPGFRIASPREALGFSFEVAPSECFLRNGSALPFGCHGWWRYDRRFWEPHLLPPTHSSATGGSA